MTAFSEEFIRLWDEEVKPQVIKCSPEYENLYMLEGGALSQAEKVKLGKELDSKNYKDLIGQYFIRNLIWATEHALADDSVQLNFINRFVQVRDCLNDKNYWNHVFRDDRTSSEAVELLKLANLMNKLFDASPLKTGPEKPSEKQPRSQPEGIDLG